MTASEERQLPLWRLISGLAVMGSLVALLILAGLVYANDYRLDRYMRSIAGQPQISDGALSNSILDRAKQLGLPVRASDIVITRATGEPHIRIEKFTVQTKLVRMDLRMPAAESR